MPKKVHDGIRKRCDCPTKKWATCSHPWHFSFHHGGKEYRYSLDVIAGARNEKPPASKSDAISWRDRLRSEIRLGTFVDPAVPITPAPAADSRLTVGDLMKVYLDNHVRVPERSKAAQVVMTCLLTRLGG